MTDQAGAERQPPVAREGLAFRKPARAAAAPAAMPGWLEVLERGFVIVSVAVFLGITILGRLENSSGTSERNPLNTIVYMLILAGSALLLWIHRRQALAVLASNKLIVVFMAWAVVSVTWSLDSELATRRLILFFAPFMVALYAAARFDATSAIKLAGWAYFWTILISAIVAVTMPSIGVMQDSIEAIKWANLAEGERLTGDWSGILGHKNVLGFATLANTQIFAWRWYVEKEKRWLFALIILFGIFVAYKAHSATSAILICVALGSYLFIHVWRKANRLRALILCAMALFAGAMIAMAIALPEQFTALVGKDATLTGRVPIWDVLLSHTIPNNPILGYGFNTYFIPSNPDYLRLIAIVGWPAPHAHNGYLNLAVELGIPGAILGTLILVRLLVGAVRLIDDPRAPWVLHVLVFGVTFAVLNMVESSILRISDNWEFALLFCCFALSRHQAENRSKPEAPPRLWGQRPSKNRMEFK